MDGEAAGEEDALLRSGPLRPALEKEVLISDVGVSACDPETQCLPPLAAVQTYTGLPIQNRARVINSWTK
jgi:hypothetical protein